MASISYLLVFVICSPFLHSNYPLNFSFNHLDFSWIHGHPNQRLFFLFRPSFPVTNDHLNYGQWEVTSTISRGVLKGQISHLLFSFSILSGTWTWWWAIWDHAHKCNVPGMAGQERSNLGPCIIYGAENCMRVLTAYF